MMKFLRIFNTLNNVMQRDFYNSLTPDQMLTPEQIYNAKIISTLLIKILIRTLKNFSFYEYHIFLFYNEGAILPSDK